MYWGTFVAYTQPSKSMACIYPCATKPQVYTSGAQVAACAVPLIKDTLTALYIRGSTHFEAFPNSNPYMHYDHCTQVSWNGNETSHEWLALGTNSGLVHIVRVPNPLKKPDLFVHRKKKYYIARNFLTLPLQQYQNNIIVYMYIYKQINNNNNMYHTHNHRSCNAV